MNSNISIKVLYGPYECHGTIRHRIQKIYGILTYLKSNDYQFEVLPSPHINRLTIEMNDRIIYTCDIRYLKFNILCDEDSACKRIIDSIILHQMSFSKSSNIPKFAPISKGMRWQREQDIEGTLLDSQDSCYRDSTAVNFLDPLSLFCMMRDYEEGEGGEEEDYGSKVASMLHNWKQDKTFVRNYECFMQEPYESEPTSEKNESLKISLCACLSVDPSSLYSTCHGPRLTPANTASTPISIKQDLPFDYSLDEEVEDANDNLNDQATTISSDGWKGIGDSEAIFPESHENADNEYDAVDEFLAELEINNDEYTQDERNSSTKSKKSSATYSIEVIKVDGHEQPLLLQKTSNNLSNSSEGEKEPPRSKICASYKGGKCVNYFTTTKQII